MLFVIIAVIPEYEVKCNTEGLYWGNLYKKDILKNCHIKFRSQFPTVTFPSKSTIYWVANKLLTTSSFLKKKRKHNVFFQYKHQRITSKFKKILWLFHETDVSKSTIHTAIKLLHFKPYKFIDAQKLYEADCVVRAQFCNWFCGAVFGGEVNPFLI